MEEARRRFHRILESFHLACRHLGALSELWREVVTSDLSAGGICFLSDELYEVEDVLELQIRLPNVPVPLILHGRVVRSHTPLAGAAECAVEFVDVTPDQQLRIDELVQFLKKGAPPS